MPFSHDEVISRRLDGELSYSDTQVLLYNVSIGMGRNPLDPQELPFVFERPRLLAIPTFATVLGGGDARVLAGVAIDWSQVLHGEQRLKLHRPMPASAQLLASMWVSEIVDKGADKGALVTVTQEARLSGGELLYTTDNVMFARADGGCGGPARSRLAPHVLPNRAPDIIHVTETRPDQALLYRLNGDRNPLHAEPQFAGKAGFPAPILHGLCSYGIACRAVLASVCGYVPSRIKEFDVRFTSPVFPGETLHTDIWIDGERVSFRSRVAARGITALDRGRCVIEPAAQSA